ncbi:hypothetical protein THH46_20765 [Pseudomonas sp. NA13]
MSHSKKSSIKGTLKNAKSMESDEPIFRSRKERLEAGERLSESLPHALHAIWKPKRKHRDPIEILEASNRYRLPNLIPVRYGRMLRSPFTFCAVLPA